MNSRKKIVLFTFFLFIFNSLSGFAAPLEDVVSPKLIINLPSRTIDLYSNDFWLKEYKIAIGKPATPTPLGSYTIRYKERNPSWYPVIGGPITPSGPDNPLGYRWMGFFTDYGIHGTNAPWTIGETVSNGCIRMQEADVEELFEIIPLGTPVNITYDRCKVRVDGNGEVSVGIYPDVYGYITIDVEEVKARLAEKNVNDWLSDDDIRQFIQEAGDGQIVFAWMIPIKVNDRILPVRAIRYQNTNYIPVMSVAEALGINLNWDEKRQVISSGKGWAAGQVKSNIIYILPEDVMTLFGTAMAWNEGENCLEMKAPVVVLNDKVIESDMRKVGEVWAIPALPLAKSMNQQVTWDSRNSVLVVNNRAFPVENIENQPYIKITKIYDCFGAYTYWNENAGRLELTYPFYSSP